MTNEETIRRLRAIYRMASDFRGCQYVGLRMAILQLLRDLNGN